MFERTKLSAQPAAKMRQKAAAAAMLADRSNKFEAVQAMRESEWTEGGNWERIGY